MSHGPSNNAMLRDGCRAVGPPGSLKACDMWVVHLLMAFALLLAHYLSRSFWFPSMLAGVAGLYFFFRGLEGATEYFDSSGAVGPPAGPPVTKASDTLPGLVWNGDLSQLPSHDALPPQPTILYPGVVPLSIQPEADPGLEHASPQVAADPFMVQTHIRLQPEESTSGDESKDGVTRKP